MPLKNRLTRNSFYCYFLIIAIFLTIKLLSSFGVLDFLGKTGKTVVNAFIQVGLLFSISIFMFSALQKNKIRDTFSFYGFKKISFKAIIIAIALGVIVYILNVFVASFFSSILSSIGYKSQSKDVSSYPIWLLFVNILLVAVLPAICEETAHRGMLLKGLSPFGRWGAIIISSILFGLLHMNIEQFFYATLIGVLLGYISTICDTIYPAMIIHFMNNAISVIMSYSQFHNLNFDYLFTFINQTVQNNFLLGSLFFITLVGVLVLALRYLIKLLFRETTMKNMNKLQEEMFKQIAKETYLQELDTVYNDGKTPVQNNVISFDQFDRLYKSKSMDLGQMSKLDGELLADPRRYKSDWVTKVFMIASFVLTAAITIFTLIWGIL